MYRCPATTIITRLCSRFLIIATRNIRFSQREFGVTHQVVVTPLILNGFVSLQNVVTEGNWRATVHCGHVRARHVLDGWWSMRGTFYRRPVSRADCEDADRRGADYACRRASVRKVSRLAVQKLSNQRRGSSQGNASGHVRELNVPDSALCVPACPQRCHIQSNIVGRIISHRAHNGIGTTIRLIPRLVQETVSGLALDGFASCRVRIPDFADSYSNGTAKALNDTIAADTELHGVPAHALDPASGPIVKETPDAVQQATCTS